jgi:parallel beta-helix repeat protein
VIEKHSAKGNHAGIELTGGQSGSHGNRLTANTANANLDTGIVVAEDKSGASSGNSLKNNTANKNKGHGIEATAASIDGGGNRASGNATPPQCLYVVCSG